MIFNSKFSIWTIGYLISVMGLFLYSFTQIDLGLTLSQASIWQTAEKFFKNIGYFQRPLSGYLFAGIVLSLFLFYSLILRGIHKGKIDRRKIWFLIITATAILTFSYNAFSHDLFNYIFDAKIVTYYHQNPYFHKALDYPFDPMLSFMHWTHRLYPYGPIWLGLTVPLSFIGMQFFLPTFFIFKLFISICFLGTVFFVGRILKKISPKDEVFGVAFLALNPLVVIESLVSSHNDIVMMFFATWSLYSLVNIKYARSIILIIISIGVKFASAFVLPAYGLIVFFQKRKKVLNWQLFLTIMTGLMIVPVIIASYRTSFQPWYLVNILTFAALVSKNRYILIPGITISLFSTFEYLPFLYLGNWDNPVPSILFWMTAGSIVLSIFLAIAWPFRKMIR